MSRDSTWYSYNAGGRRLTLNLHVQPGARRSEIVGLHGGALKVKIAAPAADNKANSELVGFLGEALGVSKSAVAIRHGATGRRKVVEITGGPELVAMLGQIGRHNAARHG